VNWSQYSQQSNKAQVICTAIAANS